MESNNINMGLGVTVNVSSSSSLLVSTTMNPKKKRRSINVSVQAMQRTAVLQDFVPPPLSGFGDTVVANNPFDDTPQAASQSGVQLNQNHPLHHLRNLPVHEITAHTSVGLDSVVPHIGNSGPSVVTNTPIGSLRNISSHSSITNSNSVNLIHTNIPQRAIVSSNNHVNMNLSFKSQAGGPSTTNPINGINHHIGNSIGSYVGSSINCSDPSHAMNIAANASSSNMTSSIFIHSTHLTNSPHLNQTRSSLNRSMNIQATQLNSSLSNATQCNNRDSQMSPLQPQIVSLQNVNLNPRIRIGPTGRPISNTLNILSGESPVHGVGVNIIPQNEFQTSASSGTKTMPGSTNKVYPPDQPMVFNHQNPNAPPISPCGVCHKEVHANDQAILCESGCNFWFHRRCTGLSEMAYDLLMHEVCAEWACDRCMSSKNVSLIKFKP